MSHKTLFKRLRPLHYSQGLEFQGLRHLSLRKSWPREPLSGLALSVEIGLKVQGLGSGFSGLQGNTLLQACKQRLSGSMAH